MKKIILSSILGFSLCGCTSTLLMDSSINDFLLLGIKTNMGSAVEKGHTGSEVRSEKPGRIRLCAPKIATPLRWIIRIEFDSKAKRMLKTRRHPANQPVFNSRLASEMRGHTQLDESPLANRAVPPVGSTCDGPAA